MHSGHSADGCVGVRDLAMSTLLLEVLQSFSLQWPLALGLLALPLGLAVWLGQRSDASWRESLLLVLGLIVLVVGMSRPLVQAFEPAPLDTVILVIDSSTSMRASDIAPSRIDAAKALAKAFIEALPASASLGLVSMAANASVLQAPTRQREQLLQSLERISLQPGSALGSGMILAIAQALPQAGIDVERITSGSSRRSGASSNASNNAGATGQGTQAYTLPDTPLEPGSRENAVLVLLADGDSNFGPPPLDMAAIARAWGLRIYCIGIGTPAGVIVRSEGVAARVRLEDKTLRAVALATGAEYFAVDEQPAVKRIFGSLSGRIGLKKKKQIEVTHWFAVLGSLLMMAGALLNVARRGRIL
ncbi:MAG: VWA domain-containing protein [Betaproteobacteria bacterium]|nr:VWA domain-containing protein [Betaproteobacteria bacterium]